MSDRALYVLAVLIVVAALIYAAYKVGQYGHARAEVTFSTRSGLGSLPRYDIP